jgi:hypothetical protein
VVSKLVKDSGFAHSGFAHDADDLSVLIAS